MTTEVKLCECGCGKPTRLARSTDRAAGTTKGQPRRFVKGHNPTVRSIVESDPQPYTEEDRGYITPCWVWKHALNDGYAHGAFQGRSHLVHRLFYVQRIGPVPEGLELDHLCRVRACVNPTHLEPVTRTENVRRGAAAKLTMEIADAIRESDEPRSALARRYGVTWQTIFDVQRGRTWKREAA